MLRVLHIGKFYPPFRGGMEVFLSELIKEQRCNNIESYALVHGDQQHDDPSWIKRVPVQFYFSYAPIALGFFGELIRFAKKIKPDVIHLHMPNNSALWILLIPSLRKIPWVVHWHSDVISTNFDWRLSPSYSIYKFLERELLKQCKKICVTSSAYLDASTPLKPWRYKCTVVPLGMGVKNINDIRDVSENLKWSSNSKLKLLSIGRLTYYKGFETLIEAVAALDDVELLIAGEGDLYEHLQKYIDRVTVEGKSPSTRLLGSVSELDKNFLLKNCDVFCLASCERTEAFGMVLLEAMQHARPCLVSDLNGSGMPWVVSVAKCGIKVSLLDVNEWRQSIIKMKNDKIFREILGASGKKAFNDFFNIGVCERSINEIYLNIN